MYVIAYPDTTQPNPPLGLVKFPKTLENPLKVVVKLLETLIYLETFVYNNPCIYRFKCAFEYLASNQVVGGSNPSGRAIKLRR